MLDGDFVAASSWLDHGDGGHVGSEPRASTKVEMIQYVLYQHLAMKECVAGRLRVQRDEDT